MKNIKKGLSLLLTALMLVSMLSIGAMAEDTVLTSDYYTVDNAEKTISEVLYNTFVGDFLRRINSHDSVKKLVIKAEDNTYTEVKSGFVTEDMLLLAGSTEYTLKFAVLYDMASVIEDIPDNEMLFKYDHDYTVADGETAAKNVYNTFTTPVIRSSSLGTDEGNYGIFDAMYVNKNYKNTANSNVSTADEITVTKKSDANGAYLEFVTNTRLPYWFVTKSFSSSVKTHPGKYLVTEIEGAGLEFNKGEGNENDASMTGILQSAHYYLNETKADNALVDSYYTGTTTDILGITGNNIFTMGGGKDSQIGSSSNHIGAPINADSLFTDITLKNYNMTQYITIEKAPTINVFVDNSLYSRSNNSDFKMVLNDIYAEDVIVGPSKGAIGVATNRKYASKAYTYGDKTVAKLHNYKIYIAENRHDAVDDYPDKVGESSITTWNSLSGTGSAETGYVFATSKPRSVSNIVPGTTVYEFMKNMEADLPAHCTAYVGTSSTQLSADSDIITSQHSIYLIAASASANASRSYALALATISDPVVTFDAENKKVTASRTATNEKGLIYVFAAYDEEGTMVAVKTGSGNVEFDNTDGKIAVVKSMVLNSVQKMRPLTSVTVPAVTE